MLQAKRDLSPSAKGGIDDEKSLLAQPAYDHRHRHLDLGDDHCDFAALAADRDHERLFRRRYERALAGDAGKFRLPGAECGIAVVSLWVGSLSHGSPKPAASDCRSLSRLFC